MNSNASESHGHPGSESGTDGRASTAERRAAVDAQAGRALLDELQDTETQAGWGATLDAVAPGLADWVIEAVFGGTYQRPGLSLRDRQLLIFGALTALGGVDPQLSGHVRTARRIGMRRAEIAESFVHLVPYVGLPRALAGLRVAATELEGNA